MKTSTSSELLQAIQAALRGKSYITPRIAQGMQDSFIQGQHDRPRSLTQRHREVIQLLAEGRTLKEAASILNLAARTIFHKSRIKEKLGPKTNADLVRFAVKNHIVVR